jgi:serine/threonine protein kinase
VAAQAGNGSTPDRDALIGSVLDSVYRITGVLGAGQMGVVYEAKHIRLGNRVAVKLMARDLAANSLALARFRREAEITGQLGHPHIVRVFDFGTAPSGEPFLVMEFLEGEDLEERLRRVSPLPIATVLQIVKQTASALAATHARGIVHRDLKPANVFLQQVEGEPDFVKVVDFGVSKARAATLKLTQSVSIVGTPYYMAPEQASGRHEEVDHRADQWALACIAYEMVAGVPPFQGDDLPAWECPKNCVSGKFVVGSKRRRPDDHDGTEDPVPVLRRAA